MNLKNSIYWFSIIIAFMMTVPALAQSSAISGKITDQSGLEVIGAAIQIAGTGTGTVTDMDGAFTLQCDEKEGTLVVSYVGYKSKNIKFSSNNRFFNLILEEDTKNLSEVVVVGYGVQRKSDLTGAVASVKMGDAVKGTPAANITDALQGRLSGVSIVQSSGQPGSGSTIRVRGANSLLGDGGPLVVIDGIIGGSLASLNPADIASVEVLKDASATAVYGSRAANGVILVTTKSPEAGKMSISYNGYINVKTPYSLPEVMSAGDYARLANDYGQEFYPEGSKKIFYTEEQISAFDSGLAGYDYIDNVFRDHSLEQTHELSFSGGNDKLKFIFSGSYNNNEGIVNNSSSERANYRLKIDAEMRKWLRVGANFYGDYSTSQGPRFNQYNNLLISALTFPSTISPKDAETGEYNNMNDLGPQYNPMLFIDEIRRKGHTTNNYLQGYVDFTLAKGLTFRTTQSFKIGNTEVRNTYGKGSYEYYQTYKNQTAAIAQITNDRAWTNQNILSYVREFNKDHRINATAVFEQFQASQFYVKAEGIGLSSVDVGANNISLSNQIGSQTTSYSSTNTMMSFMLRANYVFKNRYMLTASWRNDASSILAEQNRWQQFPAVALAWNIKEEGFLKDVENLDQLKLRLGYGVTGNQAVPNYSTFTEIVSARDADDNLSFKTKRLGTKDLMWEKNTQYNAGIDLSTWNNKLTFNIDAYYKKSTDVLLDVDAPLYTGFTSRKENAATILNKGVEVTINATPVSTKDFSWNTTVVLTKNKGTIDDLAQGKQFTTISGNYESKYYRFIKGQPIATLWGYKCLGVYSTQEVDDLRNSMSAEDFGKLNIEAGSYKYEDIDGKPGITSDDQQVIGNGQPKFNWSWNNSFNYKGFDFSVYMIGYHGFDIYNYTKEARVSAISNTAVSLNPNPAFMDRWQQGKNENASMVGFVRNANCLTNNSAFVEKGDFIKIKSITLGYTLPQSALNKMTFTNLRVYASIQNPFLITNYSGIDPEVSLKNPLLSGIDWGYYPNGRNFMFGLNCTF